MTKYNNGYALLSDGVCSFNSIIYSVILYSVGFSGEIPVEKEKEQREPVTFECCYK